jgi:hypothetical protein
MTLEPTVEKASDSNAIANSEFQGRSRVLVLGAKVNY